MVNLQNTAKNRKIFLRSEHGSVQKKRLKNALLPLGSRDISERLLFFPSVLCQNKQRLADRVTIALLHLLVDALVTRLAKRNQIPHLLVAKMPIGDVVDVKVIRSSAKTAAEAVKLQPFVSLCFPFRRSDIFFILREMPL